MPYSSRVILDSIAPNGKRLTTVEATYPRFVHSELMTHRMLSRNSSSSRAIPVAKLMEQVRNDPVMPVYWGKNQRGMQAREELIGDSREYAERLWLRSRDEALGFVEQLAEVGLHKQIANRILEPWMFITVLISATEWDNFFKLRCHPDAQPEMRRAAELIREAMEKSTPQLRQWHLPFVDGDWPISEVADIKDLCRLSVARCARVSYLTHTGGHDPAADLALADRLAASGHWSPFEHVATALPDCETCGNFIGWYQYRKSFAGESGTCS